MKVNRFHIGLLVLLLTMANAGTHPIKAQPGGETANLDAKVKDFLDGARYEFSLRPEEP